MSIFSQKKPEQKRLFGLFDFVEWGDYQCNCWGGGLKSKSGWSDFEVGEADFEFVEAEFGYEGAEFDFVMVEFGSEKF